MGNGIHDHRSRHSLHPVLTWRDQQRLKHCHGVLKSKVCRKLPQMVLRQTLDFVTNLRFHVLAAKPSVVFCSRLYIQWTIDIYTFFQHLPRLRLLHPRILSQLHQWVWLLHPVMGNGIHHHRSRHSLHPVLTLRHQQCLKLRHHVIR